MQGSASDAGAPQTLSIPATFIQLCRMAKALQIFEVKPAYEDLATPGATSLQQYLKQVHEMNVLAAIQVTRLLGLLSIGLLFSRCLQLKSPLCRTSWA